MLSLDCSSLMTETNMSVSHTRHYFDRAAGDYNHASDKPLWRFIRYFESRALMRLLPNIKEADILELGCGSGFYTYRLLKKGAAHIDALDFSAPMLKHLNDTRITPVQNDATKFDLGRTYPVIFSAGLLEFIADTDAFFANAYRHALAGTVMIMLVPRRSPGGHLYKNKHARNDVPIHLFEKDNLERTAAKHGWKLKAADKVFPFSLALKVIAK